MRLSAVVLGVCAVWVVPAIAANTITYSGTVTKGQITDTFDGTGFIDVGGDQGVIQFDVDPTAGTISKDGVHSGYGQTSPIIISEIGFNGPPDPHMGDTADGRSYADVVYLDAGKVVGFSTQISYVGEDDASVDFGSPDSLGGWAITLTDNGGMTGQLAPGFAAPILLWSDPNRDQYFDLAVTSFTVDAPVFAVSSAPEPGMWGLLLTGFGIIGLAIRDRAQFMSLSPV